MFHVVYDNRKDDAFYVYTPSKVVRFGRNDANLYTHKPAGLSSRSASTTSTPMQHTHVQTVQENMKFYTPREIKRAKLARDLLASVGSPSVQDLKTALATNAIAN